MLEKLCKKAVILTVLGTFFCGFLQPVYAEEEEEIIPYTVVDFSSEREIDQFLSYTEASMFMDQELENYPNLGIRYGEKILRAEYALALIRTSDACDVNIGYVNAADGIDGYTNGCYGKDGAYLKTNEAGTRIQFLLSGVKGWASAEDIEILPVEQISTRITGYVVDEGTLYHEIKSEMTDDNYASIINQGEAPAYFVPGDTYYSYDGHYFYEEDRLRDMLDDYRNDTRENSINPDDPYYNYYQFVSHRTITNASLAQAEEGLENTFGILAPIDAYQDDDKDTIDDTLSRSQYVGNLPAFWMYQYEYGANALMMMSVSALESSFGRSSLSFTRNNLFGHAAYDSDLEASLSRYQRVMNSVYAHARYYISGSYCSPLRSQYHGGFFGNKSAGMNVNYSADPYWGEKAAAYYQLLDHQLKAGDKDRYTLGIKTSEDIIFVYQTPEMNAKALYKISENPDMAFVILGEVVNEEGEWYKIQSDATLDETQAVDLSYEYDYAKDIGYLRKEDIQMILKGSGTDEDYVEVTFNAAGGHFSGNVQKISYALPAGGDASATIPEKDHSLFDGWSSDLAGVSKDTVFTAHYREVSEIRMKNLPQQEYEVNDRINLAGGIVEVIFADGETAEYPLTTSMVTGYDLMQEGKGTVTVNYAGCSTTYDITVDAQKDQIRTDIRDRILDAIELYGDKNTLSALESQYILELKQRIDANVLPQLTQTQYRIFDHLLVKAINNRVRYIVEENEYDMSVSGLSLACPLEDSLEKSYWLADTYRANIKKGIPEDCYEVMARSALYLENDIKDTFTISLEKNFETYIPQQPLLYTIDKPEGFTEGEVFTVLHYADNGDVEECYTRQTRNKITFMGKGSGEYMVLSRRTSNDYADEDPVEAITVANSAYDLQKTLIVVGIASAVVLLIIIIWLLTHRQKRHRKLEEKRTISEKQLEEKPLPPVDVTQVFQVFETEVLHLDEIREAEKNDQHDR